MQRANVIYGICFTPTPVGPWVVQSGVRSARGDHGEKSMAGTRSVQLQCPDTGNMEVLTRFGSDEHMEQWLKTLLEGTIRSAFATTEPRHPDTSPPTRSGGNRIGHR
jgi:acyl-CoA dehydrogenase